MKLVIELRPTLYNELIEAAQRSACPDVDQVVTAQEFTQEAVESILADRRLKKRFEYA